VKRLVKCPLKIHTGKSIQVVDERSRGGVQPTFGREECEVNIPVRKSRSLQGPRVSGIGKALM
jgi:hypothetical protein